MLPRLLLDDFFSAGRLNLLNSVSVIALCFSLPLPLFEFEFAECVWIV